MGSKWIKFSNQELEIIKECDAKLRQKIEKVQKKITISSAKGKGRNLQQKVCQDIANLFGIDYKQSDDQCPIHSREMGQAGTDVILRGTVYSSFPFSIECKSSEGLNLVSVIEQAKANTDDNQDWLIVHKRRALASPIVIMDWDAFLRLYDKTRN